MRYESQYTKKAIKDLQTIDQQTAQRIVTKIRSFCLANPMSKAKPLSGIFSGLYRFRVGDYRVIFRKQKSGRIIILLILRIKHRKDIYE